MKKLAIFLVLALLLGLCAACTKSPPEPTAAPTQAPAPTEAPATEAPDPTEAPSPTEAPAPSGAPAPAGELADILPGSYWMGVKLDTVYEGSEPETYVFEDWEQDTFNLLLKEDGTGIFRSTYWTPYDIDNGYISWTIDGANLMTIHLPSDYAIPCYLEGENLVLSDYYGCTVTMEQRSEAAPVGTELTPDKLMGSWIADKLTIEGYESDPREDHLLIYLVCGEEEGASVYWNEADGWASFCDEYMGIWYNWTPLYYQHGTNQIWMADLMSHYPSHREYSVTVTGEKEAEMLIYFYSPTEEYPTVVACHLIPASPKSVVKPTREPVTVDNVSDLILNLRDGAEILLEPGTYNITEWLRSHPYEVGDWSYVTNEAYAWGPYSFGYEDPELLIAGVKDLTIKAAKPGELTEIVCEPRYANVLSFQNCYNITLDGITMGHTIEPGYCSGSVLNLLQCSGVFLSNMDLYGCGAYGITAGDCDYLTLDNSIIRDCTYGCVSIHGSFSLLFTNDEFRDCEGFTMLEFNYSGADFRGCSFSNLNGKFLYVDNSAHVTFTGCRMDDDTRAFLESHPAFGTQIEGDWESSTSAKAKG